MKYLVSSLALLALLGSCSAPAKPGMTAAERSAMGLPNPGPEHAWLQQQCGSWDATVKTYTGEAEPSVSHGTMVLRPLGDFWTLGEFTGDFMGKPFQGRLIQGYSQDKHKYVGVWVDSESVEPLINEGSYDAAKKTLTMRGPCKNMSGNMSTMTDVTTYPDADTMRSRMSMPDASGKDSVVMEIEYKRR